MESGLIILGADAAVVADDYSHVVAVAVVTRRVVRVGGHARLDGGRLAIAVERARGRVLLEHVESVRRRRRRRLLLLLLL